jgi:hypothetical protein
MRQLSRLSMTPAPTVVALAGDTVASIAADYESSCPVVYRELIDPALGRAAAPAAGAATNQADVTGILVAALCEIQAQLPQGPGMVANDCASPARAPDSSRAPITERSTPWPLATGTLLGPEGTIPRAGAWQDVAWEHQGPLRALPQGDRAAPTQRVPRRAALRRAQLLLALTVLVALLGLGALAWFELLAPHR